MALGRARRSTAAACAWAVGAGLLAGCGTVRDFFGNPPVFESAVEPVPLDLAAPAYTAAVPGGLLVRRGDDSVVLPRAGSATWLPGGRVLTSTRGVLQVADPATGLEGPRVRTFASPSTSVTRVDLLRQPDSEHLSSYALDLTPLRRVELPETDNPDATRGNELSRGYHGAVATVGRATFVQWHDGSEYYEDGDHGVLRIEGDDLDNVLVNAGIVSLWPAVDGSALLAVRQVDGQPCGGCVVPQEIVEVDPATGEVVGEYGIPDGYVDDWRVAAIDKVGDRVAVRFHEPRGLRSGYPRQRVLGTWVYDGSWELVEGSDAVVTWWQGTDDRIEARLFDEPARRDGYQLVWVREYDEVELPGELIWSRGRATAYGSVAGRLLPPD